jgi:predicted esterase
MFKILLSAAQLTWPPDPIRRAIERQVFLSHFAPSNWLISHNTTFIPFTHNSISRTAIIYLPPQQNQCSDILVYFHGNNIPLAESASNDLTQLSCVTYVEYPYDGFLRDSSLGWTFEDTNESSYVALSDAVLDYLVNIKKIPPRNISVIGYSLGTGIAIQSLSKQCSTNEKFKNLVLIAPFTSIKDFSDIPGPYAEGILDSITKIDHVNKYVECTHYFHGLEDINVPPSQSMQLYEKQRIRNDCSTYNSYPQVDHWILSHQPFLKDLKEILGLESQ